MHPKQISLTFFLAIAAALVAVSCGIDGDSEAQCACATFALKVTSINASGDTISPDSIFYQFGTSDTTTKITQDSTVIETSIGYQEGLYQVWAYYHGIASDTVEVNVAKTGIANCNTLSTQGITFQFADSAASATLQKIGGCGEH